MKKVLSNKNFVLLFQGAFVSEVGNTLYQMIMTFYILDLTGSPLQMSIFFAISVFVRVLISPIAGVLVDRWNRVRIIYMTDFIRGIIYFGLGLILMGNLDVTETIIALYVVTVLASINAAFFFPAVGSSIPDIVGEANLQAAQGIQGFLMQIPAILGLVFGAATYGLIQSGVMSIETIVFINAITFVISGISEMFIRTPYKKTKAEIEKTNEEQITMSQMMKDYVVSIKYIKKNGLLNMVLFFLVLNFTVIPIVSIAPPFLFNEVLERANYFEYSGTGIAFGVSTMIGAIVVGSIKFKSYRRTIQRGFVGLGFLFGVNALLFHLIASGAMNYWLFYGLYLFIIFLMAINMNAVNIPINVGITLSIDDEMRGRVFSTIGALSQLGIPFAMVIGGAVLEVSSISILGLICTLLMLVPTFGFLVNHKVKVLLNNLDEKRALLEKEQQELENQEYIEEAVNA